MAKKVLRKKDLARKRELILTMLTGDGANGQVSAQAALFLAIRRAITSTLRESLDNRELPVTVDLGNGAPPVQLTVQLRLCGELNTEATPAFFMVDAVWPNGHIEYVVTQTGWGLDLTEAADA